MFCLFVHHRLKGATSWRLYLLYWGCVLLVDIGCLTQLLSVLFFETESSAELKAHKFDQNSSPVSFKDSSISTLTPPPIPWPPRIEVSHDTCPAFTGLQKIWTQILMIVWHPLWILNHLPGLVLFIIIFEHRMVLIEALLLLNCPFNWNIDEEPSRGEGYYWHLFPGDWDKFYL